MRKDANFRSSPVVGEYLLMHISRRRFQQGMVSVDQVIVVSVVLETFILKFQMRSVFLLSIQTGLSS